MKNGAQQVWEYFMCTKFYARGHSATHSVSKEGSQGFGLKTHVRWEQIQLCIYNRFAFLVFTVTNLSSTQIFRCICTFFMSTNVYIYIYIYLYKEREIETCMNRNPGITETFIHPRSFICPRIWCPEDPNFNGMDISWNGKNFGPLGSRFN